MQTLRILFANPEWQRIYGPARVALTLIFVNSRALQEFAFGLNLPT